MPSNRNTNEPTDPIEDNDLIGAADDADEADDDDVDEDDDIIDEEDDEEDEEEDEEDEDEGEDVEEDEGEGEVEAATFGTALTAEVGGEGGSPGEAVERVRARAGLGHGSEATTTWEGGADDSRDRRDEDGVLIKRAP